MEIITGTQEELRQLINGVYQRVGKCSNLYDKYVLCDYLEQLQEVEMSMTGEKSFLNGKKIFATGAGQRRYVEYISSLFRKLDDEFIKFKEYHKEHFDEMLLVNDDELLSIVDDVFTDEYVEISSEEFCEYLFEFLKEYGLEKEFDSIVQGKRIFNRPLNENERYMGTVLHDPIKKRSNIVLCDFIYSVPSLLTVGHEFGHVFDLSKFSKNSCDEYLKYSYCSTYGEVVSTMFEKLFYDFLFKKKYRLDQLKELNSEFVFEGKNVVLDTYLITLLDDELIRNLDDTSDGKILEQVQGDFDRIDEVSYHLDGRKLSTWKSPLYAYGDYISTILKETVQSEGLDGPMMMRFLSERTKPFNPDFLVDNGFDMDTYKKIYRKDISRLKK